MKGAYMKAALVGAGTMGTSLARLMVSHGLSVTVIDTSPAMLNTCRSRLSDLAGKAGAVRFTTAWEKDESIGAVLECVTENIKVKQDVIAQAEAHVEADTVIMTNTSGLSIDEIGLNMSHPERLVGAHFFNPADVIPVVEVVPGRRTQPAATERVRELLLSLGKRPAVLKKYVPGFVANRIQHAIMRECLSLLERGVVGAEELDDIIKYSIGVRMVINGPLRQRDINGLDTHLNIARYLYEDLDSRQTPASLLEDYVAQGRLGAKTGQGFYRWDKATITMHEAQERDALTRIIELLDDQQDQ